MKKLIFGAAALLAIAAASCSKAPGGNTESGIDAYTDSLSSAFGAYVGSTLAMQNQGYTAEQKEQFLSAYQKVMASANTEAERQGALVAAQMLQAIDQFGSRDLTIAKTPVVSGFRSAFMRDSVDYSVVMKYSDEFRTLHEQGMERAQEARRAEALNSPEAQQNGRIAANYVERLKSNDSEVRTTESGLTYKITNAGNGNHATANSSVKVKYVGKHLNGEVFDQSGDTPASFNLRGVVPGFSEGLQLIGEGGSATLYIPGNLAYGPEGQPQAGIGPNEMLVFDVELVEVN